MQGSTRFGIAMNPNVLPLLPFCHGLFWIVVYCQELRSATTHGGPQKFHVLAKVVEDRDGNLCLDKQPNQPTCSQTFPVESFVGWAMVILHWSVLQLF
jgi:hypothetical protein